LPKNQKGLSNHYNKDDETRVTTGAHGLLSDDLCVSNHNILNNGWGEATGVG